MHLNQNQKDILRKNSLFEALSEEDFSKVVEHTRSSNLRMDEVLFRQQEPATEFFFLLSGKIKLSLLSFDGTEKVVDIIHQGNTFAEAIMLRGIAGYPVNAEALEDSQVLRISTDEYFSLLQNSSEICIRVMACLSVRLHWLMNEMDRLSLHNATYRLISYLLENIPEGTVEATDVNLSIPKHVIASRISVTPETLSRTLKRLCDDGLLKVKDKNVVLVNPEALRDLVAI